MIPLFEKLGRDFIYEAFIQSKITIPALLGEIFREEERELSRIYEAILKAISDGKRISTEIANQLYSEKLIAKNDPRLIHPYLSILEKLGILEKIKDFRKKRYYYFQKSPIVDIYYYLDAKYGFSERDIPQEQIKKVVNLILPRHVEQFMRNLSARLFGLKKEILFEKDIDIMLTDFKRPKIIGEVKWGKINETEIKKSLNVLNQFDVEKKILIVPDKKSLKRIPTDVQIWDTEVILKTTLQNKSSP